MLYNAIGNSHRPDEAWLYNLVRTEKNLFRQKSNNEIAFLFRICKRKKTTL